MSNTPDRVDFDEYADRYEDLLQDQLSFFSKDRGYFSDHKASLAARQFDKPPNRILDFGCGIGLSLPYLAKYFPNAELFATDISEKSLQHVAKTHQAVTVLQNGEVDGHCFDLIFAAGVFHHIPPAQRREACARLSACLSPGGRVCVFEHNPYNPVTRRMVSTCPFDEDAVLLKRRELANLLADTRGLTVERREYCLFFPEPLKGLQPIERFLGWLPLGGQYYVVARK